MSSSALANGCTFCGDAPTNHTLQYIDTGLSLIGSAFVPFKGKRPPHLLDFERSPTVRLICRSLIESLALIGIIRFSEDVELATSSRVKSVWKEAVRRGIRIQELVVFGQRRGDLRAMLPKKRGGKRLAWHYFQTVPIVPWIAQNGVAWVDDKQEFKTRLMRAGLPVPRGGTAATLGQARSIASSADAVITKPRSGSRGRHTTVAISSDAELATAFRLAQELCPFVIVEEFVAGSIYRATCVDGKLIGLMELVRPVVTADGKMSVRELREHHNRNEKEYSHLTDIKEDALFLGTIAHQGYTLDSVPPAGEEVLLAEYSERSNGGYFVDLTDSVPRTTRETIEHAARVCEVSLVGFDIISKDIADPQERFVFLEGNTLPFIEIHEIPYAGTPRSVSAALWDMWV